MHIFYVFYSIMSRFTFLPYISCYLIYFFLFFYPHLPFLRSPDYFHNFYFQVIESSPHILQYAEQMSELSLPAWNQHIWLFIPIKGLFSKRQNITNIFREGMIAEFEL